LGKEKGGVGRNAEEWMRNETMSALRRTENSMKPLG
jgi:hypothetical protein